MIDLDEIERAVEKMTPGPWHSDHRGFKGTPTASIKCEMFPSKDWNWICHKRGHSTAGPHGWHEVDRTQPALDDAAGIVALRNAAPELLRLARIGLEKEHAVRFGRDADGKIVNLDAIELPPLFDVRLFDPRGCTIRIFDPDGNEITDAHA